MRIALLITLLSSCLAFFANSLHGTALFIENFNYEDGELQATSSSLWAPTSTDDANPDLNVQGGALVFDYTEEPAVPVNNGFYGVEFSSSNISAGNLYAQFTLTVTTAPTSSNLTVGRIASFWNGSGGYRGRLWIGTGFDSGGNPVPNTFRLGITEAAGSRNDVQWWDDNLNPNDPLTVVIKYDYTAGSVSLYVNASTETDAHIEVDDGSNLGTKGFAFRHKDESTPSTNLGAFQIDDIAISTTFGDTSPGDSLGASILVAAGIPGENIFLSWKDRSFDEVNFQIERRESGSDNFSEIGTTVTNRNYFLDTTVELNVEYEYQVIANNGADLEASNIAPATAYAAPAPFFPSEDRFFLAQGQPTIEFETSAGTVYRIEESPDLSTWRLAQGAISRDAESISYTLAPEVGTAQFVRSDASFHDVPYETIGLQGEFQMPNNGGGALVDLMDFGATPNDDSDDDAPPIRNALAQISNGGTLQLPEGTLHLNSTIRVPSGVVIRGHGRTLTQLVFSDTNTAFSIDPGGTDITLRDFGIDSPNPDFAYGVFIGSNSGNNAERIWINSLEIQNFSSRGIQVRNANHVKIENCYIHHATNLGGGGFGYGIALNDSNNHNNWITECVIGPVIRHGVLIQFSAHHNLVENNICFETTEDAYDLHGEDEYANELRFNLAYWDNPENIEGSPAGFGIGNTGSTHDNSGPNNWIHHNEVYGFDIGLEVTQQSHIQYIDGNHFHDNLGEGVHIHNGGGNGVFIRGNTLTGNKIGISATRSGSLTIEANQINDNELGLLLTSDIDDYTIRLNDLMGNSVAKSLGSDAGVYEDNQE